MEQTADDTRRMLHNIAGRADHAGQVVLDDSEAGFAMGAGRQWLEPIDPVKRLYKLTYEARQKLAM